MRTALNRMLSSRKAVHYVIFSLLCYILYSYLAPDIRATWSDYATLQRIKYGGTAEDFQISHSVQQPGFHMGRFLSDDQTLRRRYKSCAVVMSSGTLANCSAGEHINSHEAVFRFNDSPVKGYEAMVGNKTTFRVLAHSGANHYIAHTSNGDPSEMFLVSESRVMERVRKAFPSTEVHLLDRWSFLRQLKREIGDSWILFTLLRITGFHHSTGFAGTVLALESCEQVSMFGVVPVLDCGDPAHLRFPYHYYRTPGAEDRTYCGHLHNEISHNMNLEHAIYDRWRRARHITFHCPSWGDP